MIFALIATGLVLWAFCAPLIALDNLLRMGRPKRWWER